MSLQLLAKQMEAKGRKGDSMLVHMTAKEVAALQKMAESAGGSLSVNPETGLLEANFLKRMLPTLVGIGVGMFGGPMAGAAAGAAVGGYQAKRNDQDVLLGAAMGGLGGYGGASIGAGLGTAGSAATSQAAAAANPGFIGPMPGAASGFEAAKAGFSGLGNQVGRQAFMQGVGGLGGLAKSAGMAANPMMAPGEAPGPTPVDDEMYSYTFDPGRTGAEETPTDSTAERRYFRNEFSPVRKIRASEYPVYAAQGGLMGLAEGGETAAPADVAAPTASEAALAYLMGERSSSAPARSPFIDAQLMGASSKSNIGVGADNMYAFDPATGTFLRNPNVAGATSDAVRSPVGTSFASSGGDGFEPAAPNPDFDTPEKQAAYYAENPTMGAITRAGQNVFGYTGLGLAQDYMDPGFRQEQEALTRGTVIDFGGGFGGYAGDNSPDGAYEYSPGGGGSDFSDSYGGGGGNVDPGGYAGYDSSRPDFAAGGIASLAKGGMASGGFVVPADVVSALGNGSTDAGLRKLSAMMGDVKPIKGKGDGLSDSIPTDIDGKQPARVADGEAYIDPKTVKRLGGAKKLYAMMDKIRAQAHGKTTQQRKVNPARVMA